MKLKFFTLDKRALTIPALLLSLTVFASCGTQGGTAPIDIGDDPVATDIQARLANGTGIEREEGSMDGSSPHGFIQRLIPVDFNECDIDVFVFRTDEQAKSASKEVISWGWTSI